MPTVASTVSVKWVDETLLTAMDSGGRAVVIGSHSGLGQPWRGLKASDLLLMAAASCSTYDVATILAKQREPFQKLDVECTGEQETEPPYRFLSIHLRYVLTGKVNPDKFEKAINLSQEKYCSVLATLRPSVKITSEFEIRSA